MATRLIAAYWIIHGGQFFPRQISLFLKMLTVAYKLFLVKSTIEKKIGKYTQSISSFGKFQTISLSVSLPGITEFMVDQY